MDSPVFGLFYSYGFIFLIYLSNKPKSKWNHVAPFTVNLRCEISQLQCNANISSFDGGQELKLNILLKGNVHKKNGTNVTFCPYTYVCPIKNNFSFFRAKKKGKLGRVVTKKQPQVVKISPHMIQRLYCERYLYLSKYVGGKKKENLTSHHLHTKSNICSLFFIFSVHSDKSSLNAMIDNDDTNELGCIEDLMKLSILCGSL